VETVFIGQVIYEVMAWSMLLEVKARINDRLSIYGICTLDQIKLF
jgi:hypothetical protein